MASVHSPTLAVDLPSVMAEWNDNSQEGPNDRVHIFVHMLSGTKNDDFIGDAVADNTSGKTTIRLRVKCNEILLDPNRVLGHPSFDDGYYSAGHPKATAMKKKVNNLLGDSSHLELLINITLPISGTFVFTPVRVSGHSHVMPIELPEEDADGNETGNKAFLTRIVPFCNHCS